MTGKQQYDSKDLVQEAEDLISDYLEGRGWQSKANLVKRIYAGLADAYCTLFDPRTLRRKANPRAFAREKLVDEAIRSLIEEGVCEKSGAQGREKIRLLEPADELATPLPEATAPAGQTPSSLRDDQSLQGGKAQVPGSMEEVGIRPATDSPSAVNHPQGIAERRTMMLPLGGIRTDGGTQARECLDDAAVADYAEAMRRGTRFPPVIVFHDGSAYWLAEGFHRLAAARQASLTELEAEVRPGTQRDAILYGCSANATHGVRRTNADKRNAVRRLLCDAEWARWSDREIANHCAVSNRFVGEVRRELVAEQQAEPGERATVNGTQSSVRIGGDGRTINTAKIGSGKKKRKPASGSETACPAPEADRITTCTADPETRADDQPAAVEEVPGEVETQALPGLQFCTGAEPAISREDILTRLVALAELIVNQGDDATFQGLLDSLEALQEKERIQQTACLARLAKWLRSVSPGLEERLRKRLAATATTLQARIEAAPKRARGAIRDLLNHFVKWPRDAKTKQLRKQALEDALEGRPGAEALCDDLAPLIKQVEVILQDGR